MPEAKQDTTQLDELLSRPAHEIKKPSKKRTVVINGNTYDLDAGGYDVGQTTVEPSTTLPKSVTDITPKQSVMGTPGFQAAETEMVQLLHKAGYSQQVIKDLLSPEGLDKDWAGFDWSAITDTVYPVLDKHREALYETSMISQQLTDDGIALNPFDMSALARLMGTWAQANVEGFAEVRSRHNTLKRKMANGATGVADELSIDFSLGIGLLDLSDRWMKLMKLHGIPENQRAEVEQLVLPTITIGDTDPREFNLGTTAAMWVIKERVLGDLQELAGKNMKPLASLFANQKMFTKAEEWETAGRQRETNARGLVPPMVAGLGDRLSFIDVFERGVMGTEAFEEWLMDMNSVGGFDMTVPGLDPGSDTANEITVDYNAMAIGGLAAGDAVLEVVADPILWTGAAVQKFLPGMRAIVQSQKLPMKLRKPLTERSANIAAKVARETYVFDDAIEAFNVSTNNVNTQKELIRRTAQETGFVPAEMYDTLKKKMLDLSDNKHWLKQWEGAGATDPVLLRTTTRSPELIPSVTDTKQYVSGIRLTEDGTGLTIIEPVLTAEKTAFKAGKATKTIDEIADELHEMRRATFKDGFDDAAVPDYTRPEQYNLFTQRQFMGPDDAEQSGAFMRRMAHSGGTSVDDVAMTPMAPEYGAIPESQLSLIDERQFQHAKAADIAQRKFEKSGAIIGEPELGRSVKLVLENQEAIVKKNLGLWRATGYKPRIKDWQRKLNIIRRWKKELKISKKSAEYTDDWLPPVQEPRLGTAERAKKWATGSLASGFVRALHPGAVTRLTQPMGGALMDRVWAPGREPMRYYQKYDPQTGELVRAAYLKHNQAKTAWYESCLRELTDANVITPKKKGDLGKLSHDFDVNREREYMLFTLLNKEKSSAVWKGAWELADDKLKRAHDVLRKQFDHFADIQGISDTDKYLEGYMRHVFSKDVNLRGKRSPEYVGLSRSQRIFSSHLENRSGAEGYNRDLVGALDDYGRLAFRKIHLQPMYGQILDAGKRIAKGSKAGGGFHMTYANRLVDKLEGKPTVIGQVVDEVSHMVMQGRWKPDAINRGMAGMMTSIWAGALAGNPRYPVMQMATGIATTAGRFGLGRTMRGLMQMGTKEGQALSKEIGVYGSFMDVLESPFGRRFSEFMTSKVYTLSPVGIQSTGSTEYFIRGVTAMSAVDYYLTRLGFSHWDDAVEAGMHKTIAFQALRVTEEANHMYGALGRSPYLSRVFGEGLSMSATQFLSFIPKQLEELTAQFNRNPGNIAMYMGMSGWLSRIAATQLGIDLTSYTGLGFLPKAGKLDEVSAPAVDIFMKYIKFQSAASDQDPEKTAQAAREYVDAAEIMIPTINAAKTVMKGIERFEKQAQYSTRNKYQRALDFSGILPKNEKGYTDLSKLTIKNLAGAIRPSSIKDTDEFRLLHGTPSMGGDLIPTAFGQRSIRDQIYYRAQTAERRELARMSFNLTRTLDDYVDYLRRGEMEKANETLQILGDTYMIRLSSTQPIEDRLEEAQSMAYMLRELMDNPSKADRVYEVIQKYGVGIQ